MPKEFVTLAPVALGFLAQPCPYPGVDRHFFGRITVTIVVGLLHGI